MTFNFARNRCESGGLPPAAGRTTEMRRKGLCLLEYDRLHVLSRILHDFSFVSLLLPSITLDQSTNYLVRSY
jgi:hypothetical protein